MITWLDGASRRVPNVQVAVVSSSRRSCGTTSRTHCWKCCSFVRADFLTDHSIEACILLVSAAMPGTRASFWASLVLNLDTGCLRDIASAQGFQKGSLVKDIELRQNTLARTHPQTPDHLGQQPKARGWWRVFPQKGERTPLRPANNQRDKATGAVGGRCWGPLFPRKLASSCRRSGPSGCETQPQHVPSFGSSIL